MHEAPHPAQLDVHERLRTSINVERTCVNPLSAVACVGRFADILPTRKQGHDQ
jgi:hypothetical protein